MLWGKFLSEDMNYTCRQVQSLGFQSNLVLISSRAEDFAIHMSLTILSTSFTVTHLKLKLNCLRLNFAIFFNPFLGMCFG